MEAVATGKDRLATDQLCQNATDGPPAGRGERARIEVSRRIVARLVRLCSVCVWVSYISTAFVYFLRPRITSEKQREHDKHKLLSHGREISHPIPVRCAECCSADLELDTIVWQCSYSWLLDRDSWDRQRAQDRNRKSGQSEKRTRT